jgi:hypothetical protein
MRARIVIGEQGRRHKLYRAKSLIESARWNMYAERWDIAKDELEQARDLSVSLRDKYRIDEILALLVECDNREKPEIKV